VINRAFWCGKRVFLTGHTGFKGGWLALWLADMGAEVHGYSLSPPTEPNLFSTANIKGCTRTNTIADIRDAATLTKALRVARPEIVLHLAAQPLVRYSYRAPVETYAVNVMGTVNLLEAVRQTPSVKAVLNVTTDKCYENQEWVWPYREIESLGGFDPYSSSKACSELVTAAYRTSFLIDAGVNLASARAGNVIGGGDWAEDRLVPDCLRAMDARKKLFIRSPQSTRPWQHVLEPLSGYLTLAERLFTEDQGFSEAWNFGPDETDVRPVKWIADYLCSKNPAVSWQREPSAEAYEANTLKLDSSKAKARLDWKPRWSLQTALDMTINWHQAWRQGIDVAKLSLLQIHEYEATAI